MNQVRVVIVSRERQALVKKKALKLFPDATLCVGESEAKAYAAACPGSEIITHPDDVVGIAPLRQWVLDNFEDERICMVDDDVSAMLSLPGLMYRKITLTSSIRLVVETAAQCAADVGTAVFGFNQAWDVRKFRPQSPFLLSSWTGGVIGIVGRTVRYDPNLLLRADIDYCLQTLMKHRVVWIENRISFVHDRTGRIGGNSVVRSSKREEFELDYLKKKWGKYLHFTRTKTTLRLKVRVDRVWSLPTEKVT